MDQHLQNLYRAHIAEGTLSSYMRYYTACIRSEVYPRCASGIPDCPHCVLAQIDRLYANAPQHDWEAIHGNILEMFKTYELTSKGTYLLSGAAANRSSWMPGLIFTLTPRREEYQVGSVMYTPMIPDLDEIRGHGELCWGGDPYEPEEDFDNRYGFTEWPEYGPIEHPYLADWDREIESLVDSSEAHNVDIEAIPFGRESIEPQLGPINMHADKWYLLRITFRDEEGQQTSRYETLFITQCPENEPYCYGPDESEIIF